MCIKIYATKLQSPGSCGTFKPIFPLSRILSPQVTALGSAQFPGYNSMGYTDLTPSPTQTPTQHESKKFYSASKPEIFFISLAFANSLKRTRPHVDSPPAQAPRGRHLPFPQLGPRAASQHPHSQVSSTFRPCVCLLPLAYCFLTGRPGRAGDAFPAGHGQYLY